MTRILITDDEADIRKALRIYLSKESYEIVEAENGKEALRILQEKPVDLVLLDIMMPVMDGITALRKIRESSNVPVILLSAKSEDEDKIIGLDYGGDDYITKPFNPSELKARIRSALRRYQLLGSRSDNVNEYVCGGIRLNDEHKSVTKDGEPVVLTPFEYGILRLLIMNQDVVYTSAEIYQEVWKDLPIGNESTVSVHIRHLREKIEINPSEPRYIKVVWGHGYKMERQGKV